MKELYELEGTKPTRGDFEEQWRSAEQHHRHVRTEDGLQFIDLMQGWFVGDHPDVQQRTHSMVHHIEACIVSTSRRSQQNRRKRLWKQVTGVK